MKNQQPTNKILFVDAKTHTLAKINASHRGLSMKEYLNIMITYDSQNLEIKCPVCKLVMKKSKNRMEWVCKRCKKDGQ